MRQKNNNRIFVMQPNLAHPTSGHECIEWPHPPTMNNRATAVGTRIVYVLRAARSEFFFGLSVPTACNSPNSHPDHRSITVRNRRTVMLRWSGCELLITRSASYANYINYKIGKFLQLFRRGDDVPPLGDRRWLWDAAGHQPPGPLPAHHAAPGSHQGVRSEPHRQCLLLGPRVWQDVFRRSHVEGELQ